MVRANTVLAPGNYDGVHRGHQALLARARAHARSLAAPRRTCVLTFDPHPMAVLSPERAPTPLTTPARKRELLLAHGVDEVILQPFDRAYAAQSPEAFVRRLLGYGTRAFVVGHDFRFGRQAAGDTTMLAALGASLGFIVMVEGPVELAGERVSSSGVRAALQRGDVAHAADLQARYHDVTGEVISGDARGRTLGFPTANLSAEDVQLPADGVYAVVARVVSGEGAAGTLLDGVANIGSRPTFAAGRAVEVHLLDVNADLYGQTLRVAFVARLRAERSFADVAALKAQIAADCAAARGALSERDAEMLAWI